MVTMEKYKIWCPEFSEHDQNEIWLHRDYDGDYHVEEPQTGNFVPFQKSCESCKIIPLGEFR